MNCEDAITHYQNTIGARPADLESRNALAHVAGCEECRDVLRGIEALHELRHLETANAPEAFFGEVVRSVTAGTEAQKPGFWHGIGIGGAVAATVLIALMALLELRSPEPASAAMTPEFLIAIDETRDVNIAIDVGHDLEGATVSVFLSGSIELAGFGDQREISWSTDLEQGVNQLRLPVVATDLDGGSLLVRLDHDGVHKVFLVDLKISG